MSELIALGRDRNSSVVGDIPLTDKGYTVNLLADTNVALTVPTGYDVAFITTDEVIFMAEAAISVPSAGSSFTETDYHMLPGGGWFFNVSGVTTLNFRGPSAANICVAFYLFGGR